MTFCSLHSHCTRFPLLISLLLLQVVVLHARIEATPAHANRSRASQSQRSLCKKERQLRELNGVKSNLSRNVIERKRLLKKQDIDRQRKQEKHERLRREQELAREQNEKKRMEREMLREQQAQRAENDECTTPQCIGKTVLSAMNRSVDPCTDFYRYSCGNWISNNTIPADRSSILRSSTTVRDAIERNLRALIEVDLQKPHHPNAIAGRFFASCMKGFSTGPLNVRPLSPFIDVFDNITDSPSFASAIAALHDTRVSGPFSARVAVDLKDPNKHVFSLSQFVMGLPHRGMYNATDPATRALVGAHLRYGEALLEVAGHAGLISSSNYTEVVKDAFQFEKELAAVTLSVEEQRNPDKVNNEVKLTDLPPSLSFASYIHALNLNVSALNGTVVISDAKYFFKVGEMMERVKTDLSWRNSAKAFLAARLVGAYAASGILGEGIYNKSIEFSCVLTGTTKQPERPETCVRGTSSFLGDAVGAAYVRKYFGEAQKKIAERLSLEIGMQFRANLDGQDWMDKATRDVAKDKLDAMKWKIGFPSKFKTYSGLTIGNSSFAANIVDLLRYEHRRNLDKLGKPVDKSEWFTTAQTVNAFYSAQHNEIVFPAGILQNPFFAQQFPDAMNYGSIGTIVGHEVSHGFDNGGRKFDKDGRLRTWWSAQSTQRFKERAQCYVDLFNGFRVDALNITLKGSQTLGENLADANGLKVAFQAFSKSAGNMDERARAPNTVLAPVLTNHQLFFVAFGQTYCAKTRPEVFKLSVLSGVHSPPEFRVLGPLSQNADFARVFKCKPGSVYNPSKRCALW